MLTFIRSDTFDRWLKELRDLKGKARILARIKSAQAGNFGDCETVGDGVSELRIHVGPGYRVYFSRRDNIVYVLLCGGDKSSQQRDIRLAKDMARDLKDSTP